MIIVRYADDIIVGFEREADARRFWDVMRERLQEFSLSLNSEKTRLIELVAMRRTDAPGAGSESRRPSSSWGSSTSAVNLDGASSSSNGEPGVIVCGRSSARSRRSCDGGCISPFPSRDDGWRRS